LMESLWNITLDEYLCILLPCTIWGLCINCIYR